MWEEELVSKEKVFSLPINLIPFYTMATTIVLIQVLEMYNMLVLITAELDTIKLTLTKCKLQMYSLVVCPWYESILIVLQ